MPSPAWAQRSLGIVIAVIICLGLAARGQAVQTETPPTGVPATVVPTVIPPTGIPVTEEPTESPTEQPTEAPTEVPTEQPTEEPTESPTEQPTEVPATPTADVAPPPPPPPPPAATQPPQVRQAEVVCSQSRDDVATPASTPATAIDTGGWTLLECTIALDATGMDRVQVRGLSSTPGWRVILVDEDAPNTPGLLNASNNLVSYEPDPESPQVRFLLGYQRSCTAFPSTRLTFEVTGSAGGDQRMEATAELMVEGLASTLPTVSIDAVWIDTERDPAPTSIRVSWTDAPEACRWNLVVTLVDTGNAAWHLAGVDGLVGTTAILTGNAISVVVPPGDSTDGEVVLTLVPPGGDDSTPITTLQAEAFTWP